MASVSQFDYINEFNLHARTYLKCKTEASEDILNRTLTVSLFLFTIKSKLTNKFFFKFQIICNSVECVDFNPKNIETSHFYNNLLSIIGTLNVDSRKFFFYFLFQLKKNNRKFF